MVLTFKQNFKLHSWSCLKMFWQQFGIEPHMGMTVSCPQTFYHIVYVKWTFLKHFNAPMLKDILKHTIFRI